MFDRSCSKMQRFEVVLVAVCLAVFWSSKPIDAEEIDLTMIVDRLLIQTRQHLLESGQDEIPIPDIDEPIEKKFGLVKATGRFEAWNGRAYHISSIARRGPVFYTTVPGKSVTLTVHLGFDDINAKYDYKARIWHVGPRGHMTASIGSNVVRLRLRIDLINDYTCHYVLEEATVEEMENFKVRVTGLGILNSLTSKIITWIAKKRRGDIMSKTQKALNSGLSRALEKTKCDPRFRF